MDSSTLRASAASFSDNSRDVEVVRESAKRRYVVKPRHHFEKEFLPLAVKLCGTNAGPCRIAFRPCQRTYQSRSDHVVGTAEDRNCLCDVLRGADGSISDRNNHVGFGLHQFCRKGWNEFNMRRVWVPIDYEVLAFNETSPAKLVENGNPIWLTERAG